MVFKVTKGGVRSGNTLRGLNTYRTKRYGRHACLVGSTSLGRRDLNRLIRDGYESDENQLVSETLAKTDVLLSLNKKQRWRLPSMVGQMIQAGDFNKGAVVSLLEKHKLKRKANCVKLVSNNARTPYITPNNNKYFSFSLDSVADDQSKRQRRRELAERLKRLKMSPSVALAKRATKMSKDNVIQTYTADGVPSVPKSTAKESIFDSDKPEYRLEVFYPCPKSCALTYNPKYTDVTVVEGKEGELEVKSNVKTQKRAITTHRKRFTSRDVERLYCEEIDDDVNEMWDECYDDDNDNIIDNDVVDEKENKAMTSDSLHHRDSGTREYTMEMLLARAEKAKDLLCFAGKNQDSRSNTKKRTKISAMSLTDDEIKPHIVYVGRDGDENPDVATTPISDKASSLGHKNNLVNNLEYFRVVLSTSETSQEKLKETYGTLYAEASCHPRRFVIDVTDDVTNLLASSKASTKEINFSSYLVCIYDGFYDDGLAAYKVAFNSMISGNMKLLSELMPFRRTSILEIMNALVCHLLDLKEQGSLGYVERNTTDGTEGESNFKFLNSRMKLKIDVFDPSDEISKMAISGTVIDYNEEETTSSMDGFSAELDENDAFCDVCYVSVTSSKIDAVSGTRLKSCGHVLCDECWASHFRTGMKDGKTVLACGGYDCHTKVGPVTLMSLLNVSEVALLLKRQAEEEIETAENVKWCPDPGCGRAIKIDSKSRDLCVDVNCACGNKLCFSCLGPAHWPATCDQAEDYLDRLPNLSPMKEYVEEESKPNPFLLNKKKTKPVSVKIEGRVCPRCKKFIEKNGGCPHMFCRCGFSMCWTCMKSWHNGACTPDYSYIFKHTRTVIVKHAKSNDPESIADFEKDQEAPPKIQKNKQRASLYQRALQQRQELVDTGKYDVTSHANPLINKMDKESQRNPEFKQEIAKLFSYNIDDEGTALPSHFNVKSHLKRFFKTTVEMKKELHRVREYTYILLQGTPNSVAKQRIMKLANDLNGFCSFTASILDLQDNQDAKTAFRRLVDLRKWAERALDALIRTTRELRME